MHPPGPTNSIMHYLAPDMLAHVEANPRHPTAACRKAAETQNVGGFRSLPPAPRDLRATRTVARAAVAGHDTQPKPLEFMHS